MTAARRRFLICLSLALAAHAALFAAIAGTQLTPDIVPDRVLTVTFSTQATAADVATPVLSAHAQRGSDMHSRRAQATAAAHTGEDDTVDSNPLTDTTTAHVQRFAPNASKHPALPDQAQPQSRQHQQQPAQSQLTRSARADPRTGYLMTWRRRVEHYGNRHYPGALIAPAPRNRLTLSVTLRADGRLHSVRIVTSSGSTELDRAAMAMVRNAAPYPAFPTALREHNRHLTFAYDWVFDNAGRD